MRGGVEMLLLFQSEIPSNMETCTGGGARRSHFSRDESFLCSFRMACVILLSALGFILVAYAQTEWEAVLGIVLTSTSCGLGETSLLAYTSQFSKYDVYIEETFRRKLTPNVSF